MKTSIRLLLGFQSLLWLCSACTKSDAPTPDKTFREVNITIEEHIQNEYSDLYYSYFVYQNDSDYNLYLCMNTDYLHDKIIQYIEPGEQVTRWVTMERIKGFTQNEILIEDLTALGWIEFFPNALTPEELSKADRVSIPNREQDTCAVYLFDELTPRSHDDAQRPHAMDLREVFRPPRALDVPSNQRHPRRGGAPDPRTLEG